MKTLRGTLRYGWLNADSKREPATFVLISPEGPGIELCTQDGKPFSADDLVSYVNREVEVKGKENGNALGLQEIQIVE